MKGIGIQIITPFQEPDRGQAFALTPEAACSTTHLRHGPYTNTVWVASPTGGTGVCLRQDPTQANGGVGQNDTQECNPPLTPPSRPVETRSHRRTAAGLRRRRQGARADLPEIPLYQQLTSTPSNNKLGGYKANADYGSTQRRLVPDS